jgi:hypothetical protein
VAQSKHLGTTVANQNLIQNKLREDWIRVMLATFSQEPFVFSSAV